MAISWLPKRPKYSQFIQVSEPRPPPPFPRFTRTVPNMFSEKKIKCKPENTAKSKNVRMIFIHVIIVKSLLIVT